MVHRLSLIIIGHFDMGGSTHGLPGPSCGWQQMEMKLIWLGSGKERIWRNQCCSDLDCSPVIAAERFASKPADCRLFDPVDCIHTLYQL